MPTAPQLNRSPFRNETHRLLLIRANRSRGMTLAEVMIAFVLLLMMSLSAVSALLQTRKMSEDNVAQATAAVIAQGIIEQSQVNPFADIMYNTSPNFPNLALRFTGPNINNLANIQQFQLPWANNSTDFTEIGALSDPSDPTSPILGVLIDLAYKDGATVIRPARYMRMRVNITRTLHPSDHYVEIVLTYQWEPPSRNIDPDNEVYLTRQLRTIRSEALSF